MVGRRAEGVVTRGEWELCEEGVRGSGEEWSPEG